MLLVLRLVFVYIQLVNIRRQKPVRTIFSCNSTTLWSFLFSLPLTTTAAATTHHVDCFEPSATVTNRARRPFFMGLRRSQRIQEDFLARNAYHLQTFADFTDKLDMGWSLYAIWRRTALYIRTELMRNALCLCTEWRRHAPNLRTEWDGIHSINGRNWGRTHSINALTRDGCPHFIGLWRGEKHLLIWF